MKMLITKIITAISHRGLALREALCFMYIISFNIPCASSMLPKQ